MLSDEEEEEGEEKTSDEEAGSSSEDDDREMQIALEEGLVVQGDHQRHKTSSSYSPRERRIINDMEAMKKKIVECRKRKWIETLHVSVNNDDFSLEAMENDFEREIVFYKQAQKAVQEALPRLEKMGIAVHRPDDYYAEMAKSDDHMKKVRQKLLQVQQKTQRSEAIRRMRDEKKFAGNIQKEALAKKESTKKQLNEAVKKHRKGMKGQLEQMLNNAQAFHDHHMDEGGELSVGKQRTFPKKLIGKGNKASRNARDKKFGYGGQKKRSKKNDSRSFNEYVQPGKGNTREKNKKGSGNRKMKKKRSR